MSGRAVRLLASCRHRGGVGAAGRRLQDHRRRHHRLDRRSRARRAPRPNGAASLDDLGRRATAPIPATPRPPSTMPRRCAPPASARRPWPCCEQASIRNPHDTALLGAYGRALADAGNLPAGARRARPRPYAGQSGLAHPQCARRGARPDGPPRRGAAPLRDARSRSCRTSRRCCPISACPTRSSKDLQRAEATLAAGGGAAAAPSRRCGRTSRWSSACRAASPRPRRSPRADLPPDEAAANVAYLRADAGAAKRLEEDWPPGSSAGARGS